jgi:hypothetical protein
MNAKLSKLIENRIVNQDCPVEIARGLGVPTAEVILHLFIAIGEGRIRESELFCILDKKYREEAGYLDGTSGLSPERLRDILRIYYFETQTCPDTYDLDELVLYASYRNRRVYMGDMYLFLTDLERTLHEEIKIGLIRKFGEKESGWWKRGVPQNVRINCAQAREYNDESIDHPYNFTTLIHLKTIMDKNWGLFSRRLPQSVIGDRGRFLKGIDRLNTIRNQVMHPVRENTPTDDDFEFVTEMHKKLAATLWR